MSGDQKQRPEGCDIAKGAYAVLPVGEPCCFWHLLTRPGGWRGHTTYCKCGTLFVLRNGAWQRV